MLADVRHGFKSGPTRILSALGHQQISPCVRPKKFTVTPSHTSPLSDHTHTFRCAKVPERTHSALQAIGDSRRFGLLAEREVPISHKETATHHHTKERIRVIARCRLKSPT